MNITSMLSDSYLQPANNVRRIPASEQQVLDREQALKNAYGPDVKVSTTYRYAVGEDGHRYISGAYVSIEHQPDETKPGDTRRGEERRGTPAGKRELTPEEQAVVRELQNIEREVVAHEAAHQAAGGGLAGGVSYTYTQGPDGRNYITGGEVPIRMPVSDNPEQTLRDMETVQRAAMAPATPSPQDAQVAAKAAAKAASARQELAARNMEDNSGANENSYSSGISSVKAGLMFGRIHDEGFGLGLAFTESVQPGGVAADPTEAYSLGASSRGLWTIRHGFEEAAQTQQGINPITGTEQRFEIAA